LGFFLLYPSPPRGGIILRDMFPPSLYLYLVFTCKMRKKPEFGWSISPGGGIIIFPTTMLSPSTRKALANQIFHEDMATL
jgi:hypothetical protein